MADNRWGSADLRRQVRALHGGACYVCGLLVDPRIPPGTPQGETLEHVIPKSLGGSDELGNLRLSHGRCNLKRDYRELDPSYLAASVPGLGGGVFNRYVGDYVTANHKKNSNRER